MFASTPGLIYHAYALLTTHKIWDLLHREKQAEEELEKLTKELGVVNEYLAKNQNPEKGALSADTNSILSDSVFVNDVGGRALSRGTGYPPGLHTKKYYETRLTELDLQFKNLAKRRKQLKIKQIVAAHTNSDWDYDRFPTWMSAVSNYTPKMKFMYILSILARIFFEIIFIGFSFYLSYRQSGKIGFDTWTVPELYYCGYRDPSEGYKLACGQAVKATTCWTSRPKEKEWFLWYQLFRYS